MEECPWTGLLIQVQREEGKNVYKEEKKCRRRLSLLLGLFFNSFVYRIDFFTGNERICFSFGIVE